MRPLFCALCLCLLFVLGCGYAFEGKVSGLPDDIRSLYVSYAENSSTKMQLGGLVTDEVRRQFTTFKFLKLVDEDKADAVLSLRIRSVRETGATLTNISRTSSRQITITLDSFLKRKDTGAVLWQGVGIICDETYVVESDHALTELNEELALKNIARELAERIHNFMFLGF
ncbi:MAG: LptE family protein [Deltaproteobacteria bacterium]|nr:LptE family protein [Deltaproteobacteria bacterium]